MVVDDHPIWRDAVARDLTEAGYDVVASAADGAQALRVAGATRLVLYHRTVQNHVQNTLGKLQLHNRVELVRYAIEHGLAGELCSTSILKSAACGR